MRAMHHNLKQTFTLDVSRYLTPYPPELLQAIKQACRDKIANKTRERERERRRGEILKCALRRRRKGPPAHVLATMTEEKRMDSCDVGFAGYLGAILCTQAQV